MFKRNRPPAAREVSQSELELLAFESGEEIYFGLCLATLRTPDGLVWARLSRPVSQP